MSVTEIASAIGEWSVTLKNSTPQEILDKLDYFGHIAIGAARVDPEAAGDELLSDSRYVGVLRDRSFGDANKVVKGAGMAVWLGDEDNKGEVLEELTSFGGATFSFAINSLLPDAVQAGSIFPLAGLYSGNHIFQSARQAIDYICSLYDAEWRVNGDGTLDAGEISDLYVTDPVCAVIRNKHGLELDYRAIPGLAKLDSDVKDFTTRVLLLAEGSEGQTVSGTADINPALNPYLDLFGNSVKRTRIVSEMQTSEGNADARAQLQLNRFTSPRDALSLSTTYYDIKGDVQAGDYVWVYDPEAKLVDETNPILFQGQEIHPMKLRVFRLSWPISDGMGVYYRAGNGEWLDLTDYVEFETGETELVVGGYNRSLTGVGQPSQDPGSRPIENSTTPDVVEWVTPFLQSTYQSEVDGLTRAQLVLDWTQPLNTDETVITDGAFYEIRFRTSETAIYPATHEDMADYQHGDFTGLNRSPIPFTQGAWQYVRVPWDDTQFLMLDLTPGIPYDFGIRAVDSGTPPLVSDWSVTEIVQTRPDTDPPSIPAAPESIAGSRNAIQVVHTLGMASGGTFNLQADINHLEVHVGFSDTFTDDPRPIIEGGTLAGKMPATRGMLIGEIPAIGTFQLDEAPDQERFIKVVAVDNFGNRSGISAPATQTAELIDSAFISELTVSKVSAGTITANWVQAAELRTASTGARVAIGWYGIEVFNNQNLKTLDIDSTTGAISMIGSFATGVEGRRVKIDGSANEVRFFPETGENRYGRLFSYIPANIPNDIAVELRSIDTLDDPSVGIARIYVLPGGAAMINSPDGDTGEVVSQGQVSVSAVSAALRFSDLSAASAPYESADQNNVASVFLNSGGVFIEAQDDGTRLGGFAWIRPETQSTIFGRWNGSTTNGLNCREIDDLVEIVSDGFIRGAFNQDGLSCSLYMNFGGLAPQLQLGGKAVGDSCSFGTDATANPIMFADGYSARYVKNFVIPHPVDDDKWLVHACTETPEAAVEYSGVVEAKEWGEEIEVQLPPYFESLTHIENRQVWLQPMLPDEGLHPYMPRAIPSVPRDGRFRISTDAMPGAKIAWRVKAVRKDVSMTVEPLKSSGQVQGDGPYTYFVEE